MAAAAALVGAGAGCSGAPLGGGKGTGGSAPPCTTYLGCGTGAGGTGGTSAELCGQLDSAYASALTTASACTPGAPDQCQALVAVVPTTCPNLACGKQAYVNDGSTVEALRGKWIQACDSDSLHSCPAIACDPTLGPAVCVPSGSDPTTGTCVPSGSDADGGAAPDGGNSALCSQIAAKYSEAVAAEQACTPGAASQCQALVATVPANCPELLCGQQTYVNGGSLVESERQNWLNAGCGAPPNLCVGIDCAPPAPSAACVSNGPGSTMGTCVPIARDADAGAPVGGENCAELAADYAAAVAAGRACTPGASGQCQVAVNTTPSSCFPSQCDVNGWVSDATAVDAAQARWLAQCGVLEGCPLILCEPSQITCVPSASGDAGTATGLCTAVLAAPSI